MTGRSPWAGGRFTVDFSASRLDTSNQFARLNPEFPSALSATWVQPLARGRSIDADRRNILLARRAVDLTDAQLTQVVMDQLTLVEEAYWDLAFAARNLDVLTSALTQARGQAESNQRQVTQGTLAPIDVIEAQTQVSRFQQAVASGEQALTAAENRLKRLMLANRAAPAWNQPLVPGDLEERSAPPRSLDEALKLRSAAAPSSRHSTSTSPRMRSTAHSSRIRPSRRSTWSAATRCRVWPAIPSTARASRRSAATTPTPRFSRD